VNKGIPSRDELQSHSRIIIRWKCLVFLIISYDCVSLVVGRNQDSFDRGRSVYNAGSQCYIVCGSVLRPTVLPITFKALPHKSD